MSLIFPTSQLIPNSRVVIDIRKSPYTSGNDSAFSRCLLSKPNVTQLKAKQSKATQKQLRWVRHSSHMEPTTTITHKLFRHF